MFYIMSELDTVDLDVDLSEDDPGETKALSMLPGLNINKLHYTSSDILLESLIHQICKYVEKDNTKQKRLYYIICDKLHELNLLGKSYKLEELQYVREKYMNILQKMILAAKCLTDEDIPSTGEAPHSPNIETIQQLQPRGRLFDWSRYAHEFREMDFIARGGFGQVYNAHNILDGCAYAVKKICLKYYNVDSFIRSLREVQTLAKLNHPNIVAYKAAWLEPFDSRKQTIGTKTSRAQIEVIQDLRPTTRLPMLEEPKTTSKLTSNSFEIEFRDSTDSNIEFKNSESQSDIVSKHSNSVHSVSNHTTSPRNVTTSSSNGLSCLKQLYIEDDLERRELTVEAMNKVNTTRHKQEFNYFFPESQTVSTDWVTLYIQMQLCEITLKQWLSLRAFSIHSSPDYKHQVLYIFQQIVQGLEYIHTQGIVHHDIKPSNIFVSHDLKSVQVGDFGLACCLITHSQQNGSHSLITAPQRTEHPLGTRLYAAPEQLHGLCDPKSDVYSLGIVLFEMLINFSTDMEKSKEITRLKMGHMPPHISTMYPRLAKIITKLLDVNPKRRPSASQILLFLETKCPQKIGVTNVDKDNMIAELTEELNQRKEEIASLQLRIQQLELESL